MKICCIQMNVRAGAPEENFSRAESLLKKAAKKKPDVILLPETWNTGFAPGTKCALQEEARQIASGRR